VVQPDYGIFTKLDFVHAQFFNTKEEIWEEKRILLDTAKQKIYLWNFDEYLTKIFDEYLQNKQFFPQVEKSHFSKKENKIFSEFVFENKTITANIFGQENLEYIALALQIALDMWIELSQESYDFVLENQPGRFHILEWIKGNILIDSSYNAAPASMKKMIENTFALQKSLFSDYKVFLVLGDMRELWEISAAKHLELNDSVIFADGIYCIGKEIQPLYQALEVQQFEWEKNIFTKANIAGQQLKNFLENTDQKYVILFKWSQNTIFTEEALKEVLLNQKDVKNLVRQSSDWIEKKENFFNA
jgi:UDP-N-acetylmuramyl pentapeptide synthase